MPCTNAETPWFEGIESPECDYSSERSSAGQSGDGYTVPPRPRGMFHGLEGDLGVPDGDLLVVEDGAHRRAASACHTYAVAATDRPGSDAVAVLGPHVLRVAVVQRHNRQFVLSVAHRAGCALQPARLGSDCRGLVGRPRRPPATRARGPRRPATSSWASPPTVSRTAGSTPAWSPHGTSRDATLHTAGGAKGP